MGILNSQEEVYLRLHALLLRRILPEHSSLGSLALRRDIQTLESRTTKEGLAFLTKTLPLLGKSLDQALVSGRFTAPHGFRTAKGRSTPAFMSTYFNLVFKEDGSLLEMPDVGAIKHLRQVLYFAYKLELPYTNQQKARVIESFVSSDKGLELNNSPLANDIIALAKIICWKVFHDFDHRDIHPRHGPGAVATGEKLEDKWTFARLYDNIHQVFPYYDYYVVGGARELQDRLEWYRSLERLSYGVSKVVLVPKDSRGPRLISCEPLEYQWIQQGLGRKMASYLEWTSVHTRHHVNFTRQEINASIAKSSSATQRYATIDLKDASDRVSLELVRAIFQNCPDLLRALEACRTHATKLPDGSVLSLKKFAPMGSALCFPVESFLFWAVLVASVVHGKNLPLNVVEKRIFVYGDDIIVPTEWSALCIQGLEEVGLIVNASKSCITGFFRESCGTDAFMGVNVTPFRLSNQWTGRTTDGSGLASYSALANKMADAGYHEASEALWVELEKVYGKIPLGLTRSSYPCRLTTSYVKACDFNRANFRVRWNRNLHRTEFLLPSLSSRRIRSKLDGWLRLMRNVVTPPYGDPSVVVVARSTRIKRAWTGVG